MFMNFKTNQLKLNTQEQTDKIKYYVAFSYLFVRPLFKSKLLEYFDFDIKRAFLADKKDLEQIRDVYDDRIFSRMCSNINALKLNIMGEDLRLKK